MAFEYKNPNASGGTIVSSFDVVGYDETTGVNFSVHTIGGYMEVWSLGDLNYTIPSGSTGNIRYSGNTIPITYTQGLTTPITTNSSIMIESDGISSGRRRLGMLVYVHETDKTYQYRINDYENLFNAASGATTVNSTTGQYTINNSTTEGQDFINLWLDSSIEGVSGVTKENARWVIFHDTDTFITGGTYNSGTTTLTLSRNDGQDIDVTGFSASGLVSVSANTGLGIENDVLYTTYNTLLDSSLSMAETIGGLEAGTTVADISGDTFVSLFNDLLFPTVNPTYTIPTISIGGVGNSTREVGTTLSLSITASATKNDSGNFTQLRVLRDGSALVTDTTMTISSATDVPDQFGYSNPNNPNSGFTLNSSPYSESYTVPAPGGSSTSTSTQYRVDGNYDAGLAKNDNKGSVDTRTPVVRSVNAPQAASNNFQSSQYTYTGIYPYFWGVSTTQPTASDIVDEITGGTANKVLSSASSTITITFGASSQYLWFAHFTNYTNKTVWYVDALNSGSIGGGTNLFGTPTTNSVNSPDGYWSGINFEIYISNYQTSTTGSMQLRNS